MKPTVRDIAKKAGVSIASVSLVLNNKPSRITDATKQKILSAAVELGYHLEEKPAKKVYSEDRGKENHSLIGVIRPGYFNEFLDSCQCGIDRYAYVHGYKAVACSVADSTEQALEYLKVLRQIDVKGIIMVPPKDMNENSNNEKLGRALQETKVPFLLLDQAIDRVYCDFITGDNKGGAYMAAEYLIHQGHREIGMISGNREIYTCRKRIEGYKEALAFYDISIIEENIFYGNTSWQTGYKAMEYFDKRGIRAVFACEDEMAFGVYKYAQENELQVGKEISVVGFNDASVSSILIPALTSINLPGELMGKKACEVLVKRIEGADKEAVRTTYFAPRMIERASVRNMNCF